MILTSACWIVLLLQRDNSVFLFSMERVEQIFMTRSNFQVLLKLGVKQNSGSYVFFNQNGRSSALFFEWSALPFIKIENRVLEKRHKSQAKDLGRDEIAKWKSYSITPKTLEGYWRDLKQQHGTLKKSYVFCSKFGQYQPTWWWWLIGQAVKSESDMPFDQSRIGHAHMPLWL